MTIASQYITLMTMPSPYNPNNTPMAHWKRASFYYFKTDVADAMGISMRQLQYYCKKTGVDLTTLTLTELVAFINSYPRRSITPLKDKT